MAAIQRHHVAAGSYIICEPKPFLLQAYLGTCVGLALYCKTTGIGGMIHLLLPEPVSRSSADQAEKYASTGVPLLIESMLAKGAKRESLAASLAGGALVGPISEQDLALDIGGRTAEVTRIILKDQGIKLLQSETGGFFTCCLSLNMSNGQCTIEPAGLQKWIEEYNIKTPSSAEIKGAMDHLQPIPQVALKVLRLIEGKDRFAIQRITDEISKDQVITARTLKLANSAMFTKMRTIESLDQALVYLGTDQVYKLIISAAVQSYFEQSAMGYSLCKGGLYHHAVGCAQVAESLAKATQKVDPRLAYTAGLLHDIGKVVLDQYVASAYPLFYRQAMEKNENVITVEKRFLGMDHTEVGRLLAQQWSFPESLVQVIRHHHQPDKIQEHRQLAVIVYLADLLLSRFQIGLELERIDTDALIQHLDSLDLSAAQFSGLVELIPDSVLKTTPDDAVAEGQ
ncbi:MAG: HDOD domain-containing protein [Desulfobacteraceae bacterium]|nr:HDOD domain-containing protein [Desulfobacteraceae bacterium]